MAVFLRAEVFFVGVHWGAALRAERAAAADNFDTPMGEGAQLGSSTPKTQDASFFRVPFFGDDFAGNENEQVTVSIVP